MAHDAPIRLGIVGCGGMGASHARVAATVPGCTLVGVYDVSEASAARTASAVRTQSYASLEALCADVEAVIIATPATTHAAVGATCLQAGCHVLIEKPIAPSATEAEGLLAVAQASGRLLLVGHVERFNPAFTAVMALLPAAGMITGDFQRLSPTAGRDRSVDIIFDLLVHDLELALALVPAPVTAVTAVGHQIRHPFIDHVAALVRFANGATATLTASAISQERQRMARLYTPDVQFVVDFARRTVSLHRQGTATPTRPGGPGFPAHQVEHLALPLQDALATEQTHFLDTIRAGACPLTDAERAVEVVRLAELIQQQVTAQLPAVTLTPAG